jgi:signal transduction histidine kinase
MATNEQDRLDKLKYYDILDSGREQNFDELARLASAICGTPIGLISLVEKDRQWFKSVVGLENLSETPRNISFCHYAIQSSEILEVDDTLMDQRFMGNPYVFGEPHIRFYAGAPLTTPDGHHLGTICVLDKEPHHLTDFQREALKTLSHQVIELIELRRANKELAIAKKRLENKQKLLINKARIQTIGELAGGVCHQINNPLAIIVGRSMILRSRLKDKLPENPELLKELDVIDQTSQRISDILKALRLYSKDLGHEFSEHYIHDVLNDALTLIRGKLVKEKIDFKVDLGENVKVMINKNQITQVLLDLINNSIEAMEELETKDLSISFSAEGETLNFNITDSGKGIKKEEEEKIFLPFFSTKARHFGVGLYNVQEIIYQHRGEIHLLSGKDPTVFQVKFPKSV